MVRRPKFLRSRKQDTIVPHSTIENRTIMMPASMNRYIFMILALSSLGGCIFGFDTAQIGDFLIMPAFVNEFGSPSSDPDSINGYKLGLGPTGLIVSFIAIGALFGAFFASFIADRLGRKRSNLTWFSFNFIGNFILIIMPKDAWLGFAIGRLICGIGVGGLSTSLVMFAKEVLPPRFQEKASMLFGAFISVGMLAATIINILTGRLSGTASYRVSLGCSAFLPIFGFFVGLFPPEPPQYDIHQAGEDIARDSLAKMYSLKPDSKEVSDQIAKMKTAARLSEDGVCTLYETVANPAVQLCMLLQVLQQLTGANYLFYYGADIFKAAGVKNPYVTPIILTTANFGGSLIGLYLPKRFSSKTKLFVSALVLAGCQLAFSIVGIVGFREAQLKEQGGLRIAAASLFLLIYSMSWGILIWGIIAQRIPGQFRSKGLALATASNWTFNFILSLTIPYITARIGCGLGFVFTVTNLIAAAVVKIFLIEAKAGSSPDEVYAKQMERFSVVKENSRTGWRTFWRLPVEETRRENIANIVREPEAENSSGNDQQDTESKISIREIESTVPDVLPREKAKNSRHDSLESAETCVAQISQPEAVHERPRSDGEVV